MERAEFNLLFDQYWEELFLFAKKRIPNKNACQDIVQEVFMSIWDSNKEITHTKAYLYQSVRFQIYKHYRDSNLEHLDIDKFSNFFHHAGYANNLAVEEINSTIDVGIKKMPSKCRKIFEMSRKEQYSTAEIAEKLNLSKQTVKNQISKALKIMRIELKDYLPLLIYIFFSK